MYFELDEDTWNSSQCISEVKTWSPMAKYEIGVSSKLISNL